MTKSSGALMKIIEGEGNDDAFPENLGTLLSWTAPDADSGFGERGEERTASLAAFLRPDDEDALHVRVKLSTEGIRTLVTTEARLQEGDTVYVESGGQRRPHRISRLRKGLRSRDPDTLRVGQLTEIAG